MKSRVLPILAFVVGLICLQLLGGCASDSSQSSAARSSSSAASRPKPPSNTTPLPGGYSGRGAGY